MKFSIKNEKYNPFLERKELQIEIDHSKESTPNKTGFQSLLAKEFNIDLERILIKNIFSRTGSGTAQVKVFILDKALETIEKQQKKNTE